MAVVASGLLSVVQDLGRAGHYSMGLPPSGAMDMFAHRCANLLVGNDARAATLEMTVIGPTLAFERASLIAVTGADMPLAVDGAPRPGWSTVAVPAGAVVTFGPVARGCRAYLAVAGGIDTEPVLGSRSTYLSAAPPAGVAIPPALRTDLDDHRPVRVVEGLCNHRFRTSSLDRFFAGEYVVTTENDRTGCRLTGPGLEFEPSGARFGAGDDPSNVIDLGYPVGSIQAPNGDQPICLMRDAVTGGGYATLGTVISVDTDRFAQVQAPQSVGFASVTVAEALAARSAQRQKLFDIQRHLRCYSL
jgi:allophanate hydrolase subunit 2